MAGRRYTRDNRGRFASTGATARGGRLATASGNKRATQTAKIGGGSPKGTVGKPKGLKPGSIKPKGDDVAKRREANSIRKGNRVAVTDADRRQRAQSLATAERRLSEMERTGSGRNSLTGGDMMLQAQRAHVAALREPLPSSRKAQRAEQVAANRGALARKRSERKNGQIVSEFRARAAAAQGDGAVVNIPMAGRRGRSLDAEITRNVKAQKAADRAESKVRNRQFKSEQSRAKKMRSVHVPAIAKAKGISRAQVESALQAQSPSTQIKALKNWVKTNRKNAR